MRFIAYKLPNYLLIITSIMFVLINLAHGQSKLPNCPQSGKKHNCYGTITFSNGNKYVGEWKYDKFDGQGTFNHFNYVYKGEWKAGLWHGYGVATSKLTGDERKGFWEKGILTSNKKFIKVQKELLTKPKKIMSKEMIFPLLKCNGQHIKSQTQNFNNPYSKKENFDIDEMLESDEIILLSSGEISWKDFYGEEEFILNSKGNLQSKNWVSRYCRDIRDNKSKDVNLAELHKQITLFFDNTKPNESIVSLGDKNFKVTVNQNNINQQSTSKVNLQNSNVSNTCLKLQNKILVHIDNDDYGKASSARKLMKEMGCSINANNTSNNSAQKKYTSSELNCNVGPLGKFLWAEFGKYSATAYNDNPPKSCLITYDYCKSRARAIAKGANIPPSEKSPDSYSANCNVYGSGNKSVNCNVRPNSGAGGFAGGLADSLSEGIDEASKKQDIYVSNFELCMTEMGYQLSKR